MMEQQNKHTAEMIKQLSNSKSSPSSYPSFNSIDYFDHSLVTRDDDGTEVIVLNGVCSIDTKKEALTAYNVRVDGTMPNVDRTLLFDSGSPAHLAPNDKLAVSDSVRSIPYRVKLLLADRTACMYADRVCDIIVGEDKIIQNVLIVPTMKNVIISESKLTEQNLHITQSKLGEKELCRIENADECKKDSKISMRLSKPMLTIHKEGPPGKAGLYYYVVPAQAIRDTSESDPLSNGKRYNRFNGTRQQQETFLTQQRKEAEKKKAAQQTKPIPKKAQSSRPLIPSSAVRSNTVAAIDHNIDNDSDSEDAE
jgi:hypothetical protein